ncbi:MAG: DUF2306 domain-containing protein [Bacteroidota bacterium]
MSTIITSLRTDLVTANRWLRWSISSWFIVAVLGQWIFALYVLLFYGGVALTGDLEGWNAALENGIEPGKTMNNTAIAVHLLLAIIIHVGGPLQFIPQLRKRALNFHRWNGRVYAVVTFITALTGLFMIWEHRLGESAGSLAGMTLGAAIILAASLLAWRFAVKGDLGRHERWAVRLFLAASGVWFFRIILMGWFLINGGPVGVDTETMTGPFMTFIYFGHYLLPLAIYELYLFARKQNSPTGRYAMAGLLFASTVFTVLGVFAATVGMWLPML